MEKSILKHDTRRHTHNISMYLRLLCRLWRQLHKKKNKKKNIFVAMRVPVSFPSARHFYNPIKKMFNVALTERFSHPIPFHSTQFLVSSAVKHLISLNSLLSSH